MEVRFMDELFNIEQIIGEVAGVLSLQFSVEKEFISEDQIVYE